MSLRTAELARRKAALRLRCAAQRNQMARQVDSIQARLEPVDRVATAARRVLLRPAVVVGGTAMLVILLGRARTFRVLGRGLVLLGPARRLARVVRL